MDSVVLKFGGTSVQDAAALRRLVAAVAAEPRHRVVVVSALAGVTDTLSDIASGSVRGAAADEVMHRLFERHVAIIDELVAAQSQRALIERLRRRFEEAAIVIGLRSTARPPAERDALLAMGELASSEVVAAVLTAAGMPASWVDAREIIATDDTFGHARPQPSAIRTSARQHLDPLLAEGHVPVLGGFIGSAPDGATTTLGRGGSDYSAALVGAAIAAREIQIWTDVDGVLTCDPRVVERATLIPQLSFHEAYELARFGAKVLHWGTLEPAATHAIPVRVLNSVGGGGPGTIITSRVRRDAPAAVGLAYQVGVTVADVRPRGVTGSVRFLQTGLDWLAREQHGVTVVTLSATRLVTVAAEELSIERLLTAVDDVADAQVTRDAAVVTAVGDGITGHAAVWSVLTAATDAGHVEAVIPAHSGDALVCVTSRALASRVLSHLHDTLFGSDDETGSDAIHAATQGVESLRVWGSDPVSRSVNGV